MGIINVLHRAFIPTREVVTEQGDLDGASIYSDPEQGLIILRDEEARNFNAVSVYSVEQANACVARLPRKDEDRLMLGSVIADSTLPYQALNPAHTSAPAASRIIAAAVDAGDERLDDDSESDDGPYRLTSKIGVYFLPSTVVKEEPFAFVYGPTADGAGYVTHLIHCMRHFHAVMYGTNWDDPVGPNTFRRVRLELAKALPNNHPRPEPERFPGSIGFIMGVGLETLILKSQRKTALEEAQRFREARQSRLNAN